MKIFANKLLLLAIVVIVAAGIILVPQLTSGSKEGDEKKVTADEQPCDEKAKPRYCELRTKIIQLGKSPWNKSDYRISVSKLQDYLNNKHISIAEQEELKKLLNSKYLGVLAAAIRQHCQTANSYNGGQISEYESALKSIESDADMRGTIVGLTGLLGNYRTAVAMPERISGYLASAYDDRKTASYRAQITSLKKAEVISANNTVVSRLRQCEEKLNTFDSKMASINRALNERPSMEEEELRSLCTISGVLNTHYYNLLKPH